MDVLGMDVQNTAAFPCEWGLLEKLKRKRRWSSATNQLLTAAGWKVLSFGGTTIPETWPMQSPKRYVMSERFFDRMGSHLDLKAPLSPLLQPLLS